MVLHSELLIIVGSIIELVVATYICALSDDLFAVAVGEGALRSCLDSDWE